MEKFALYGFIIHNGIQFGWLMLGKMVKLCSEMNRYYIFESSPLKHFSRFDADLCAMTT